MRLANLLFADYGPTVWWVAFSLTTVLLGALGSTTSAVTYHDLRVLKDGVGVDELAAVFE
jgi:hypothetical protein